MSNRAKTLYEKVISKEQTLKFRVFIFASLKEVGLDLKNDFSMHEIYKFLCFEVWLLSKAHLRIYDNLRQDELDEEFGDIVIKSRVNDMDI